MTAALQSTANDEETFCPDWFAQYGIQGFPIRHIEADSSHLLDLKTSIKARGYDPDQPIILARSKDKAANGYVEDGRHRLWTCEKIRQETGVLPDITVKNENQPDLAHAKLRQIYYEAQHLAKKSAKTAKEHIITLYDEIKESQPQLFKQRTLIDVFRDDGKIDDEIKLQLIVAELSRLERQRKAEDEEAHELNERNKRWTKGTDKESDGDNDNADNDGKSFTSEIEVKCEGCRKTHNYPCNITVFKDGTAKVELVA